MNIENEIIHCYRSNKGSWKTRRILSNPSWVTYINNKYPNPKMPFSHKLKLLDIGINSIPKCQICNNSINFYSKKTCSIKCRDIYAQKYIKQRLEKSKKTLMSKYGVDNAKKVKKNI